MCVLSLSLSLYIYIYIYIYPFELAYMVDFYFSQDSFVILQLLMDFLFLFFFI